MLKQLCIIWLKINMTEFFYTILGSLLTILVTWLF